MINQDKIIVSTHNKYRVCHCGLAPKDSYCVLQTSVVDG